MSTTSLTKVDTITKADIADWSADDIASYVGGAQTAVKNAEKFSRNATDRAAYATWLGEFAMGVIGKVEGPESNKADGWMTDAAWAEKFGKTRSNVGYWRILGRLMMDLGVTKDEPEYIRFRTSNLYQTTDGKKIVMETATADTIRDLLNEFMEGKVDANGKRLPKPSTPNTETADEKKARLDREKAKPLAESMAAVKGKDDEQKAQVVFAAVAEFVKGLDRDGFKVFDDAYLALQSEMVEKFAAEVNVSKAS